MFKSPSIKLTSYHGLRENMVKQRRGTRAAGEFGFFSAGHEKKLMEKNTTDVKNLTWAYLLQALYMTQLCHPFH